MRVLITGATGFLGTHVVLKSLQKGASVIGIDRDDFYFCKHLAREIEFHKLDIREITSHAEKFPEVDVVVHCAAALHDSPPEVIYDVNLKGTESALELCVKNEIPKFILCSSTVVYGYFEFRPPVFEDSPLAPVHPYAISKMKCEKIAERYRERGINTCIVRPKSFAGAGRLGVFQLLCDWIMRGAKIPVIGRGTNRYQLLGVSDLAEGIYAIANSPVENEVINLGADKFRTVKEDLEVLLAHANTGSSLIFLPARPTKFVLSLLERLHLTQMWSWHYKTADRDSYVDTGKAQRLINWKPAQSNVDVLTETYDWFVANYEKFKGQLGLGHHGVLWRERLLSMVRDWL